ncbi:MAG: hypothetical protein ACOYO1_18900 [Bacteroidales bacterium]
MNLYLPWNDMLPSYAPNGSDVIDDAVGITIINRFHLLLYGHQ